jgi:hypothetical protein
MTVILLIVDAATGGRIKQPSDKTPVYGTYHPNAIFPIYMLSGIPISQNHLIEGISYGMVELIRRVIPRDIVGGHVQKLRKMDAMVYTTHILSLIVGPRLLRNRRDIWCILRNGLDSSIGE